MGSKGVLGVTPRAQPWVWSSLPGSQGDDGAGRMEFLGDRFKRLKLERWEQGAKDLLMTALLETAVLREGG